MVYARTKLTLIEYIYRPIPEVTVNYSGPNPQKLYKKIKELMLHCFQVPPEYIQEKDYIWEATGEKQKFKITWTIEKIIDKFTYYKIEVELSGFVEHGKGMAAIKVKPEMYTDYPQDTFWQQSLIYEMIRRFWHAVFYEKTLLKYLENGKRMTDYFLEEIKKYLEELRAK